LDTPLYLQNPLIFTLIVPSYVVVFISFHLLDSLVGDRPASGPVSTRERHTDRCLRKVSNATSHVSLAKDRGDLSLFVTHVGMAL
jgi:hypothetical protein